MKQVCLIILILSLAVACNTSTKGPSPAGVVDVSGVWDADTVMMLSTIAENIEYVPLELTPDCILGDYYNVRPVVLRNYILVSEYHQPLRLFSRSGRYIGKVGGIGKGPMEYNERFTYSYDEEANLIVILDMQMKKLLRFNFKRDFIALTRLTGYPSKIVIDGPDKFGIMYLPWNEMEKDTARFDWINANGKVLNSVRLYRNRPKDGGGTYALSARLYKTEGHLRFIEAPYDTIYQLVDNREFKPAWYFNEGPNSLSREITLDSRRFNEEFQTHSFIDNVMETKDYMFIRGVSKQLTKAIFYNIRQGKAWSLKQQEGFEGFFLGVLGFHNDLDGGVPFWPTSWKPEYLVSITAPEVLLPAFKDRPEPVYPLTRPDLRPKLFKMVSKLTDNDNPVVVIVTLKR